MTSKLPRPQRKMDGGSHSTSSVGSGQEDPVAALDLLCLQLHDQLPQDARERFAKISDEVKKLKDAAQTTQPPIPPPSSDQEFTKCEEETVEARQSSREITKGEILSIHCAHLQHVVLASYGPSYC